MRIFVIACLAALLTVCSNSYYGYDQKTWESMNESERQVVIDKAQKHVRDMEEESQFQKDKQELIDWTGKGP